MGTEAVLADSERVGEVTATVGADEKVVFLGTLRGLEKCGPGTCYRLE